MIEAGREAREEHAQAATDWNRYKADQAYREQMEEQERQRRKMATSRERDEPDPHEPER
jgi:hypothetical protein